MDSVRLCHARSTWRTVPSRRVVAFARLPAGRLVTIAYGSVNVTSMLLPTGASISGA